MSTRPRIDCAGYVDQMNIFRHSEDKDSFLQKEQNRKIEKKEDMVVISKSKSLEKYFIEVKNKQERNRVI